MFCISKSINHYSDLEYWLLKFEFIGISHTVSVGLYLAKANHILTKTPQTNIQAQ